MRLTESKRLSPLFLAVAMLAVGCRKNVEPPDQEQAAPESHATSAATSTATPAASTPSLGAIGSSSTLESTAVSQASAASSLQSADGASGHVPEPARAAGDPLNGKFSLQDATKGLAPTGKLVADIVTDAGKLSCELFQDKAPIAVANFVGLARGLRPFKDPKTSEWVKRPAYDGTGFHRIIKGFMIQGGDPTGTGAGEPGYVFQDEVWSGASHDRRGLLCMANRGPNTNGMQFFILDGAAKHLDRSFTIFGSCGPDSVIEKLASSEVRGDKAVNPPKIKKVTIRRGK